MAESTELSTFVITGGVPSDPKEIKAYTDQLAVGIKLAQAALNQKGIDPDKYKEILAKGQEWAGLKLKAELQLKDHIEKMPKNAGGNPKTKKSKTDPKGHFDSKKNKTDRIRDELGLKDKQYREIKKLTPYGVQKAIEKSNEDGEIPTRYKALQIEKRRKDQKRKPVNKIKPTKTEKFKMYINIKISTSNETRNLVLDFIDSTELEFNFLDMPEKIKDYSISYLLLEAPFSYIGSKAKLIPKILPYLEGTYPDYHETIVSPFLGSGALEVNLVNRGFTDVVAYDYSPDISNLWIQMLDKNEKLQERIHHFIEDKMINSDPEDYQQTYHQLWDDYFDNGVYADEIDKAAVYWILQHGSFNGKIDARAPSSDFFRKVRHGAVRRLKNFNELREDGASFTYGGRMSFEESIPKHPNDFLYCDPPYLLGGRTHYGVKKLNPELHKDFDHKLLADILNSRKDWILSYNDCPEIRKLYKGHKIIDLKIPYSTSSSRDNEQEVGEELLIFG